jgi:pseudouridine-5'-phosphate glycosidase
MAYPQNLETALGVESIIRAGAAVPATIAVIGGRLKAGLSEAEIEHIAKADAVMKATARDLPYLAATGRDGATTVAATMRIADLAGIAVFATGGIGGVHRGAIDGTNPSFDISADLDELARTPVAVVCAGPKAILDVPRTLEYLETRGVPVVAIGIDEVPGFYARGSGLKAPSYVDDVAGAAAVVRAHEALGLGSGLVICVPVPEERALSDAVTREAVDQAIREADHTGVTGAALTPWLLARVAAITDGASVKANIALIVNNAKVAGELAGALAGDA